MNTAKHVQRISLLYVCSFIFMSFVKQRTKESNNMCKQQTAWANSLETLPPRPPVLPPFQTMCARLSAKTPASLDLQISPEIEESAAREIFKQSGASFFPSPDLTCPIWRFFSRLSNLFLQIFCVPQIYGSPRRSLLHTLFN